MEIVFKGNNLEEMMISKKFDHKYPAGIIDSYRSVVYVISQINTPQELWNYRGFNFEKLKNGKYKGKYSIRLNKQRRLMLDIEDGRVVTIILIEINKHYE